MQAKPPDAAWNSRTRHDLIIEVWEALDCESVGARELEQIQEALRQRFGAGGLESPASIARTVADEGALLRHPEVFQFDSQWRERLISETQSLESLSFSNLAEATEAMRKLESRRTQLLAEDKREELRRLEEFAVRTKTELLLAVRSGIVENKRRSETKEVAQWLTVWLQNPALFEDWLSLRQRSREFIEKFN